MSSSRWFSIVHGNALELARALPDDSIDCIVTSPPYWGLRDYGTEGQLGLEETVEEYVEVLVKLFDELRRSLSSTGTCWVNLGDTYVSQRNSGAGWDSSTLTRPHGRARKIQMAQEASMLSARRFDLPRKSLIGVPWRVAFALQASGWILRRDIIWSKTCPLPESVYDRPSTAHEYVFLLTKRPRYHYDADAVRTPLKPSSLSTYGLKAQRRSADDRSGLVKATNWALSNPTRKPRLTEEGELAGANLRSVWEIASEPYAEAHFATMPTKLVEPCVAAGCPPQGLVLDPFAGAGTVGVVALRMERRFLGFELNPEYIALARRRILEDAPLFNREREGLDL